MNAVPSTFRSCTIRGLRAYKYDLLGIITLQKTSDNFKHEDIERIIRFYARHKLEEYWYW